jgi:putative endonuclease
VVTAGEDSWHVYILECADGTLYTGATNDVKSRVEQHNRGRGAKYTRSRLPVGLVYLEVAGERALALRREREIKRLTRASKRRLIAECAAGLPSVSGIAACANSDR